MKFLEKLTVELVKKISVKFKQIFLVKLLDEFPMEFLEVSTEIVFEISRGISEGTLEEIAGGT